MKYLVVVGDGMADYPLEELGGRTPLEEASTPNMDSIARRGAAGMLRTIPPGMDAGSDIANLSILGYDPRKYYTGRGPLEAASLGVELGDGEFAWRCNLITVEDGRIADFTAGHITSAEARELVEALNRELGHAGRFYPGVSYRHLFVSERGEGLSSTPPHDVVGARVEEHLLKPKHSASARELNELMLRSREVLEEHEVNRRRVEQGKRPANMIWLWGQGKKPELEPFAERFGITGAAISAVDLIRGIARLAGMRVVHVPGATGYYDTDYRAKAEYALRALEEVDFCYIHVEAPDEAGHEGSVEMKLRTIEDLDGKLIGRLLDGMEEDTAIAVLPDHPTPIRVKTHTPEPVPFAVLSPRVEGDGVGSFSERECQRGSLGLVEGTEFIRLLLA
ncbi:MAG: cofactor-independent phosphoglycerate mutase [Euryarchaeota archaeon]|nr:cofactor-independent phosphoglycerate mutase [Euryarchaeota archaeon]